MVGFPHCSMAHKPEYEFVHDLNYWVRWEQDPDDPFSFTSVRLTPTAVAELQLEVMDANGDADGMDACTDQELVSWRHPSAAVLRSASPAQLYGPQAAFHVLCTSY